MKQYTMSATENLKFEVEKLRDDLEFKLEKTCMPRPQVLGMCTQLISNNLSFSEVKKYSGYINLCL